MRSAEEQRMNEGGRLDLDLLTLEEKAALKIGNRLISCLHSAVKAAQLYDDNNEGFTGPIHRLMETMHEASEKDGHISLEVYMSYLFFNRLKIKTEFQNYVHVRFLIDTLRKRDAEGVVFSSDLTREEVMQFIRLLVDHDRGEPISFDVFQEQILRTAGHHITMQRFSETTKLANQERLESIRRQAKRVFFESMSNLKGIMLKERSDQFGNARRIRRHVQSVVDLIGEDESYLIGLTTMKHFDQYILNHSVNVCMLSVALGQRAGLGRNALRELGIAGMFHDLGKMYHPSRAMSDDMTRDTSGHDPDMCHPQHGVEMMMQMRGLGELPVRALKAILEHHLKYDISGYPVLSQRKELDLFSRIISIVNHFDVETTPHPSNPTQKTAHQVISDMVKGKGRDFDPLLLDLFIHVVGIYPIGSLVTLSTGEIGLVVQPNIDPKLANRPMVRLIGNGKELKRDGETVDLSRTDPHSGGYIRTIIKCLDPWTYKVNVAAILAQ